MTVANCATRYPKIILGSASPRRREILRNAGVEFETIAGGIDESQKPGEAPKSYVRRMAAAKCKAVHALIRKSRPDLAHLPILAADTVVVFSNNMLGKPASADDARVMLRALSGNVHQVMTGVSLLRPDTLSGTTISATRSGRSMDTRVAVTRVCFRNITDEQIAEYIASGEPLDKAGAYGIQGLASKFVKRIDGCYFNVVGLPIALVCEMLEQLEAVE